MHDFSARRARSATESMRSFSMMRPWHPQNHNATLGVSRSQHLFLGRMARIPASRQEREDQGHGDPERDHDD
jgi:hypothetical protein